MVQALSQQILISFSYNFSGKSPTPRTPESAIVLKLSSEFKSGSQLHLLVRYFEDAPALPKTEWQSALLQIHIDRPLVPRLLYRAIVHFNSNKACSKSCSSWPAKNNKSALIHSFSTQWLHRFLKCKYLLRRRGYFLGFNVTYLIWAVNFKF